ncbi:MAG TPA: hypothetical protein VNW97_03795 [Candidatus Saccharimonadales bacterium]|nr:hypothetical protein [Candidatus Saccharimonadales bacterium]
MVIAKIGESAIEILALLEMSPMALAFDDAEFQLPDYQFWQLPICFLAEC